MNSRLRLLAASLLAMFVFTGLATAAGLWNTLPLGTTVPQQGCVPTDVYGPEVTDSQGVNPATVCLTPGQIAGQSGGNASGKYSNIPIGSVAYGSLGTETTPVSGTIYWSSIQIPVDGTATAIACMNGGTAATDELIYGLYNSAGTLVANTALAGVTATGTDVFQSIDLTADYEIKAGLYWVAWQTNGTTTRFRTVATATYINLLSDSDTGTFGTLTALTVPTTFTADVAPICYVLIE